MFNLFKFISTWLFHIYKHKNNVYNLTLTAS